MGDHDINWAGWIVAGTAVLGGAGAMIKKFLSFVSRGELQEFGDAIRDEQKQMHNENQAMLNRIHERVDSLWERRQITGKI